MKIQHMKQVLMIFLAVALFSACDNTSSVKKVSYKVTGSAASFDVTLTAPNGNNSQYSGVASGATWSATGNSGDFIYLSAQNATDQGDVTVTLSIDGSTFKTATSSGAYVIASVDGDIP